MFEYHVANNNESTPCIYIYIIYIYIILNFIYARNAYGVKLAARAAVVAMGPTQIETGTSTLEVNINFVCVWRYWLIDL